MFDPWVIFDYASLSLLVESIIGVRAGVQTRRVPRRIREKDSAELPIVPATLSVILFGLGNRQPDLRFPDLQSHSLLQRRFPKQHPPIVVSRSTPEISSASYVIYTFPLLSFHPLNRLAAATLGRTSSARAALKLPPEVVAVKRLPHSPVQNNL